MFAGEGGFSMSMSRSEDDGTEDMMKRKVDGRKRRVTIGYQAAGFAFILASLASSVPILRKAPAGALHATSASMASAGIALILSDAALNDRLRSDTYKRLNLLLCAYGMLVAWSIAIVGKLTPPYGYFILPSALSIINSVKGYGYGLKGWRLDDRASPFQDIWKGAKSTVRSLFSVPTNASSVGYILSLLFSVFLGYREISLILEGGGIGQISGGRIIEFARVLLLWTLSFTLKDAADRNRLKGSTFIELNWIQAYVFGCLGAVSGWKTRLGASSIVLAAYAGLNGYWKNMQKKAE